MAKKQYVEGCFGTYLVKLIKTHSYAKTKFATELVVSKTYLFDVPNERVKLPTPDTRPICMIVYLNFYFYHLTKKNKFYHKTDLGKNDLPKNIVGYLTHNQA